MGVTFVRIDDRLIHGQVVTAWTKQYGIQKIIVIDDGLYKDEFMINILKMVAPSGIELQIESTLTVAEKVVLINKNEKKTMLLLKFPNVAKKLLELGIKFNELNLGGMGAGPNRKVLYRNVSVSDEELATLNELNQKGVIIYLQAIPTDKRISLENL